MCSGRLSGARGVEARPFNQPDILPAIGDGEFVYKALMKIVIIGNSGSGKTWLATRLAALASVPVIHLDELFWRPGGFDEKRSAEELASLIKRKRIMASWVVEGVFGELATPFLEDAQALIWLNPGWPVCRQRLLARGSESKAHMGRAQSEAGLARLLEWASAYSSRDDTRSIRDTFRYLSNSPCIGSICKPRRTPPAWSTSRCRPVYQRHFSAPQQTPLTARHLDPDDH